MVGQLYTIVNRKMLQIYKLRYYKSLLGDFVKKLLIILIMLKFEEFFSSGFLKHHIHILNTFFLDFRIFCLPRTRVIGSPPNADVRTTRMVIERTTNINQHGPSVRPSIVFLSLRLYPWVGWERPSESSSSYSLFWSRLPVVITMFTQVVRPAVHMSVCPSVQAYVRHKISKYSGNHCGLAEWIINDSSLFLLQSRVMYLLWALMQNLTRVRSTRHIDHNNME